MRGALRFGIDTLRFWDLTPKEVIAEMEAKSWKEDADRKNSIANAWLTAALVRSKRLPPLSKLLNSGPARKLVGEELEKRRQEFKDMTTNFDLNKLTPKKDNGNDTR